MGSNDINDKLLIPKIVETYKDKPSILEFKCGNCGIIFKRSVANISGRVRKQTVQNAIENKPVVTFCSHQCYNKYSKDHNIGMHSKESKENNKIKQIENAKKGIGAWSDEAKAIKAKKRKEHVKNKTGAWSYEARVKQCETKKKNGTNQYDPNVTRKTFQIQYNNKIGIFSEEGRANQSKWLTEFNKTRLHNEFCEKCNKITLHNATICSICNPKTLGGMNMLPKPNFMDGNHCDTHKNENLTYKGECWSCFKKKFSSLRESYSDLPEIPKSIQCKYCKNVINDPDDIFCSIKCKELFEMEKYKSFKSNNHCNLHKNEKITYKNKCWSCFKNEFSSLELSNDNLSYLKIPKSMQCKYCKGLINNINDLFCSKKCEESFESDKYKNFKNNNNCNIHKDQCLSYKGKCWECFKISLFNNENSLFITELKNDDIVNNFNSFWQNTYRLNDHNTIGQDAMEKELMENNIQWFVYIKFYKDMDGTIKPLVVGKTGSLFVNKSGSDINFSTNDLNKPARKFLNDTGFKWFVEKVYIIPVENEPQAYYVESYIHNKYNLFYS